MMELAVRKLPVLSFTRSIVFLGTRYFLLVPVSRSVLARNPSISAFSSVDIKPHQQRRRVSFVSSALPETVASVAIVATVVGAAATVLVRRNKAAEAAEVPMKDCKSCGGSGICPECKGEGFVLKRLSDESAERARLASKNAATRYTAGLPKKWSYCSKCSSARSCSSCGGRGKIVLL